MFNTAYFSRMPKSEYPGTRMKKPQPVSGTSLHGEIIPVFCNLVMPGTIDSNIVNGKIWMSQPIQPIASQIKCKMNVFFVPLRLVWNHTKEFFGENKTNAGPQTTTYNLPQTLINSSAGAASRVKVGSVSHYLGKPLYKGTSLDGGVNLTSSPLKERAYWLCVSEYYRHQQVQNPVLINTGDITGGWSNAPIGTLNGSNIHFDAMPAKCLKDFDYFTTATISPNYGGDVLLPLGSLAPIIGIESGVKKLNSLQFETDASSSPGSVTLWGVQSSSVNARMQVNTNGTANSIISGLGDSASTLYADLSQATAAKIDDLYTAMAAQAWYHNANFGSRYFEAMEIHYGVSNPDLVLDRPEHVSEFTFDIVVSDVISTAGATSDATTKLGQPGAYSKTFIRKKLYNHSFGEWGYVICLMNMYHQRYYSAGLPREDSYRELFDLYFPEFANRGDDFIFRNEVFANSSAIDGLQAWAYQEAYADRRYYQARATGQLDPYCDAGVNGKNPIGRWILSEKWSSRPSFGSQFLEEDRDAIKDALVSGSAGPDYVWDFNFEHTEILPMPAYSKPGIPSFGRGII